LSLFLIKKQDHYLRFPTHNVEGHTYPVHEPSGVNSQGVLVSRIVYCPALIIIQVCLPVPHQAKQKGVHIGRPFPSRLKNSQPDACD
jgi:hypothetical protein